MFTDEAVVLTGVSAAASFAFRMKGNESGPDRFVLGNDRGKEVVMRKIIDDIRLIYKCCYLYYMERKNQAEICQILKLSRTSVSRMLELGRQKGIVQIDVINPDSFNYGELEQKLQEKYHLKEVIVVEGDPLDSKEKQRERLSEAAFMFLTEILRDGDCVGVSMGRTLHYVSQVHREYDFQKQNLLFVPMYGGISQKRTSRADVQSNRIAVEFAEKFGGDYVQFLAPAVFSSKEVKNIFLNEETMRYIYRYFNQLRIALLGIGVPEAGKTGLFYEGYLTEQVLNHYLENGAVGEAALRFFDIHGNEEAFHEFNERVVGIEREQLLKIEMRIGIAGGSYKANAVKGAIRARDINILITDLACAKAML